MIATIACKRWRYVEAAKRLAASAYMGGHEVLLITDMRVPDWNGPMIVVDEGHEPYWLKLSLPELIHSTVLYLDADSLINWKVPIMIDFDGFSAFTTKGTTLIDNWDGPSFHSSAMVVGKESRPLFKLARKLYLDDIDGYAKDEVALMRAVKELNMVPNHISAYMGAIDLPRNRDGMPIWLFQGKRMGSNDAREYQALSRKANNFYLATTHTTQP